MPAITRADIRQFAKTEVTINGATPVTVTNEAIVPGCVVIPTLKTVGGTVGDNPSVKTITAGSLTIAGTAGDTSTYVLLIA